MKKSASILALSAIALVCSTTLASAQAGPSSMSSNLKWVGVWQGQLESFPGVVLTLGDDLGELSGTMVFTAIRDGVIAGHTTRNILHPHLDGNRLSFQVKDPRDGDHMLEMSLDLTGDSKGKLLCAKCEAAPPIAMEKIP